jgi:ElaB/YqjD/DUF883 family membrane-anchored ribosome-binding protein
MSAAGRIVNDVNDLETDADRLGGDAYRLGQDVGDATEEAVGRRADEIERLLLRIEDTISSIYDTVVDRGARSIETVEDVVEENPWLSILAAFAAGALATHLLSRR